MANIDQEIMIFSFTRDRSHANGCPAMEELVQCMKDDNPDDKHTKTVGALSCGLVICPLICKAKIK
jgi:hypothetical protein